jgi:hypothetical protein
MANKLGNIVGSGIAAQAGNYLSGIAADNLTATGSTQGTALLLPADYNTVTTTAASTGVIMPINGQPGDETFVANLGANALTIYPPTGESINALAANAGYSLAAAKSAYLAKVSATRWVTLLSA